MKIIRARNVNHALRDGVEYILNNGKKEESRVGNVLVSPVPVTTIYERPSERVLFSDVRDANPFFHLAEAFWMLLGRADGKFLDRYIKDFSTRFAEEDGNIHGAYGRRWRNHFVDHQYGEDDPQALPYIDQLELIVQELKEKPTSRQVVLTMWDPEVDLGVEGLRDRPCNTHIYFRLRERKENAVEYASRQAERGVGRGDGDAVRSTRELDMTVCCRSNDLIMGAYGANAVHFSVLQEFVASCVGASVGFYYQMSNNFHAYERDLERLQKRADNVGSHHTLGHEMFANCYEAEAVKAQPLADHPTLFIPEVCFLVSTIEHQPDNGAKAVLEFKNPFLRQTAFPMLMAHELWRQGDPQAALISARLIEASDWRKASVEWIQRHTKVA